MRLAGGLFVQAALLCGAAACENPAGPSGGPAAGDGHAAESAGVRPDSPRANAAVYTLGTAAPAKSERPRACPEDMVLVKGAYCPEVEQTCRHYLDPPGRYHYFRCAEYAPPRCASKKRVMLEFCIDREEYTEPGQRLPANFKSFSHAQKTCRAEGKRVCRESEWNFACEGEAMLPYPYGTQRDSTACNADHTDIISADGSLKDLRAPSDAYPRCVSPFGVRNLAGNLEEFVARDGTWPPQPAMKGAYWQPSRNFCRAAQTAHDEYYNGIETGFRCCADAPFSAPKT